MNSNAMYEQRLAAHRAAIARLQQRERAIGAARGIAFALIVVVAFVKWGWLVLVPALAFIALVIATEPLRAAISCAI